VVITDDQLRIQGFQEKPDPAEALSDLANCGIYMFDREIFDYFPEPEASKLWSPGHPAEFADWALDVFPALMESGIPFYAHQVDAYWNDVGTISEFIQGSFDGLTGAVDLAIEEPQVESGQWIAEGTGLEGVEISGPVLIGPGCRIEPGAVLSGPLVIGAGSTIGSGARVKEAVLLDKTDVNAGSFVFGGALGALPRG
jgi:mannose-1-phosphate guanylyltransferase/mannose-1-phosphate guanylyltransferase/phosphomannomutase